MLPDPENMGIAVGNSLLSCVQAEMKVFQLETAILDFWPRSTCLNFSERVTEQSEVALAHPQDAVEESFIHFTA